MGDQHRKPTKPARPGWPLPVIPAGEMWWRLFCRLATDEQVDTALVALEAMTDRLVAGQRHEVVH